MSGRRGAWLLLGLGLIGSQAGHLVAYALRFGSAAQAVQSTGAHAYFPTVAKTGLGLAALALLVGLLVVGVGRVASGRRIEPDSGPSLMRLVAALYTIQLACFAAQETIEAIAGGGPVTPAPVLLLIGTAGQLPVALVAALAMRWWGARLRPALAALALGAGDLFRREAYVLALRAWQLAPEPVRVDGTITTGFNRRGPPSF